MQIKLNGETVDVSDGMLSSLLPEIESGKPFAVAVNTQFVPKSRYAEIRLQEGDEVEIVRPVVGG